MRYKALGKQIIDTRIGNLSGSPAEQPTTKAAKDLADELNAWFASQAEDKRNHGLEWSRLPHVHFYAWNSIEQAQARLQEG